jgi:hypothetical protein
MRMEQVRRSFVSSCVPFVRTPVSSPFSKSSKDGDSQRQRSFKFGISDRGRAAAPHPQGEETKTWSEPAPGWVLAARGKRGKRRGCCWG